MDHAFRGFLEEFRRRAELAPHWQLKKLSKALREVSQRRFPSSPTAKVETVERAFTEEELERFLAVVDDEEHKAAFTLMASLGLRVGELAALKGKDLEGEMLRISGAKGGYSGYLRLPPALLSIFPACGAEDRIFPRTWELARAFRLYRAKSGLLEVYAQADPGGRTGIRRPLYRLSMHSLRHYAIQRVMRHTKDPDLARRFARHKKLDTTLRYLRSSRQAEIEAAISELASTARRSGAPSAIEPLRAAPTGTEYKSSQAPRTRSPRLPA